jgi:hypothetical protein
MNQRLSRKSSARPFDLALFRRYDDSELSPIPSNFAPGSSLVQCIAYPNNDCPVRQFQSVVRRQ